MIKVHKTRHPPVSISRRLSIVLGIVSLSAGECDASQEPAVFLAASAPVENVPVQHERLVADGIVERYVMDPRGDVEGGTVNRREIYNESTGVLFRVPFRLDVPALPLDRLAMIALKVEGII